MRFVDKWFIWEVTPGRAVRMQEETEAGYTMGSWSSVYRCPLTSEKPAWVTDLEYLLPTPSSSRVAPGTVSFSAPSQSVHWPSIFFLLENVFRTVKAWVWSTIFFGDFWLRQSCWFLHTYLRALMMSVLDSGQGDLISHPCNSPFDLHTAAGNDSEHKVWMWSCPVQHRVFNSSPRTQKKCFKLFCLASAQVREVLSACSLSLRGALLLLSTLVFLIRILPFFTLPSLALSCSYPNTLPTWWACSFLWN